MNPVRAIATCFARYALFLGRAPRSEFWWWALLQVVMITALAQLGASSQVADLWMLATITPTVAVAVRRMRDAGIPPVLLLLILVPILNVTVLYVLALPSAAVVEREPEPASAVP